MAIEISGFDELRDRLHEFPATLQKEIAQEILASALTIVRNAKVAAPVATGRMANAISFSQTGPLEVTIVSPVRYSAYQEFGTGADVFVPLGFEDIAARARGAGIKQVNMMPQAFLIPALQAEEPLLIARINQIISDSLT